LKLGFSFCPSLLLIRLLYWWSIDDHSKEEHVHLCYANNTGYLMQNSFSPFIGHILTHTTYVFSIFLQIRKIPMKYGAIWDLWVLITELLEKTWNVSGNYYIELIISLHRKWHGIVISWIIQLNLRKLFDVTSEGWSSFCSILHAFR
jgi:hypothetical protein